MDIKCNPTHFVIRTDKICNFESCIKPLGIISIGHQIGENKAAVWFSHWFTCSYNNIHWYRPKPDGPVTWERKNQKITMTYVGKGQRIWILQDEFDSHNCQLGAWPD